ncbi:hypothetical protein CRENBAI_013655 [Crenichthys baileyi]|uniref:Ankyrin repeat domain 34Bb n=1 Tax=Crenichthys baileyi TaxID=28760 RepID=A0AAV9RJT8_9TELE
MNESTDVGTDGSSLLKAVYQSRLRLTRLLLEGGAYINESNEHGETPLMVACKTPHKDAQSVPKSKMVRYLLENGADPNIQDKMGKTALMHACLEQTDAEILSLLLKSGADPTLEDHAGLSALVYAVNSGNRKILSVLLGACKAKGKEVIIITTNKMLSAHRMTKQYLNVPPSSHLEEYLSNTSVCSYTSTHDAQIETFPRGPVATRSPQTYSSLLGDPHCLDVGPGMAISHPASPTQPSNPVHISDLDEQLSLYSVNTEESPSLLLQQNQASSLLEKPLEYTLAEEEQSIRFKVFGTQRPSAVSRHHNTDVRDGTRQLKSLEHMPGNENVEGRRGLGRKMSYDSAASSLHATSHPNMNQDSLPFSNKSCPVDEDSSDCNRQLNVSSLRNVVNRRNIGMDHYSSDSQLLQVGSREKMLKCKSGGGPGSGPERPKQMSSRPSALSGSKESLESSVSKRGAAALERRGSGALLLDHIAHTRPGYLPPLNPHAPIPDIGVSPSVSSSSSGKSSVLTGSKSVLPSVSAFRQDLKVKNMLWRRHSMQNEQIKQLVSFTETFGH